MTKQRYVERKYGYAIRSVCHRSVKKIKDAAHKRYGDEGVRCEQSLTCKTPCKVSLIVGSMERIIPRTLIPPKEFCCKITHYLNLIRYWPFLFHTSVLLFYLKVPKVTPSTFTVHSQYTTYLPTYCHSTPSIDNVVQRDGSYNSCIQFLVLNKASKH